MDHNSYISATSWRYGTNSMKKVFSEVHKRQLLRKIWYSLAKAESTINLVTKEQLKELKDNIDNVDIVRATEIENEIKHDLMAEIKTYSEQCPTASSVIHLGCTSMDVLDASETLRQKEALNLVLEQLKEILEEFEKRIDETKDLPVLAFTHIQPAEITTLGYRLSQTAQDLIIDYTRIKNLVENLKTKGLKGACGTSSSFKDLTEGTDITAKDLEDMVMNDLGLKSFTCATQVYTRKQDYLVLEALSSIALSCSKFALDLRVSQSPMVGELSEPFGSKQVGSSAMPFKRNPINSEKINSLCRQIASYPSVLWQDGAYNILERTLDDSANRRIAIADSFILTTEVLKTILRMVKDFNIHKVTIKRNLDKYGPFSATERLLMASCKKGANRQDMHEVIRELSLIAWKEITEGRTNPLLDLILKDNRIKKYLSKKEIIETMRWEDYYGDSLLRCNLLLEELRSILK